MLYVYKSYSAENVGVVCVTYLSDVSLLNVDGVTVTGCKFYSYKISDTFSPGFP